MNRYQLEVAEMDRRQRIVVRLASFVGVGLLMIAALWSAGLPPNSWFHAAHEWMMASHSETTRQRAISVSHPIANPDVSTSTISSSESVLHDGTDLTASSVPLSLYLLSTSPGRNLRDGTAQIGTSTTDPRTYAAGALLANGATLDEIHNDFVILKRGERTAKLSIFKLADNAALKADNDLLRVGGSLETRPLPAATTYREVLTEYMRPSPIYDGQTLRGYQVYPGQKASIFLQMGLQAGDVITAINDVRFVDPAQSMELFRQLADGVAVTATIERKDKSERITLDGALIVGDQERSRNAQLEQPLNGLAPLT